MKHIDTTVKTPPENTIALPSWYGTAAGAILMLATDPHALDGMWVLDMDAVHHHDASSDPRCEACQDENAAFCGACAGDVARAAAARDKKR